MLRSAFLFFLAAWVPFTQPSPQPTFSSLAAISPSTNPSALLTVGNEQLVLFGSNFGPSTTSVLTYTGPSPLRPGFLITYSPPIVSQNDSAIVFRTAPGIGANLQFTVRKFDNVTGTSGALASYAIPTILNITVPAGTTAYTPRTLRPQGGDTVVVNAINLGPLTYPGQPTIYTPTLRFGGTGGTFGWFYGCKRQTATAHIQITCRVPVGGGTNHTVRVQSGFTGQWSATGNLNALVSFVTPTVLSTSPTIGFMSTAGLEQIVIRGLNMPYPSWVINGFCPVSASFGPAPIPLPPTPSQTLTPLQYRMPSCTGAFDTDGRTPVVTCQTPAGSGRGYVLLTRVGGIFTNFLLNRSIAYSPPSLYDFSGPGAFEADTLGNQTVIINGKNFGFNSSLVQASYTLLLKNPLNTTGTNVTYRSPFCNMTIPHVQLACLTAPGVGADLTWSLIVDGQRNINPVTSYAGPQILGLEVRNATSGQLKSKASTVGGDILIVRGKGFGLPSQSLIQSFTLLSVTGMTVSISSVQILSDQTLQLTLPPAGGSGWQASVTIADLTSEPSTANFSYADPTLYSISPPTGPTTGGVQITLFARDLVLTLPGLSTAVLFGNPSDGSLVPTYLPTSIVPRPTTDNNSTLPYISNAVSFLLPPGAGAGRAIRLITYLTAEGPPPLEPGTPLSEAGPLFQYSNPEIQSAVLALPFTQDQIQTATNCFGAEAIAANGVRMLSIYGQNFGQGSYPFQEFGIQWFNQSVWQNVSSAFFCVNPLDWRDTVITAYTPLTSGLIRIQLTTLDPQSNPIQQVSNMFSYNDLSPYLMTNTTGPFPTVGGTIILFQAMYLSSATFFNISTPCILIDPQTQNPLTTTQEIYQRILTNPGQYSPPGLITSATIWTFPCLLSSGQGSAVPITITRQPDGGTSNPVAISYLPPTITLVNGQAPNPIQRIISSTEGDTIVIEGANFGPCPSVELLPSLYTVETCKDQPGSVSAQQNRITVKLPPGEGMGLQLSPPLGWLLAVRAADQSTAPLLFGWAAPEILSVTAPSFPTIGGTVLTLQGRNFGQSLPTYPQALLPPELQIQVRINATVYTSLCASPQRFSHSVLECILPEGGGQPSVVLSVAGQSSAPITFFYDRPILQGIGTITNTTLVVQGLNFGIPALQPVSCIFLSNRRATGTPRCNGLEDYAGEGELPSASVLLWNHSHCILALPPGTGSPVIRLIAHGQLQSADSESLNYTYPPPTLYGISQASGPADGGYPVILFGDNFGSVSSVPSSAYPIPLPLQPEQRFWTPVEVRMNGVSTTLLRGQQGGLVFTMLPGIGMNYSFQIFIDEIDMPIVSNALTLWSYDPPIPTGFLPNPIAVGDQLNPRILLQGLNLGSLRAFATFPTADPSITVIIDTIQQDSPQRVVRNGQDAGIEFTLTGEVLTAGSKDLTVIVASQSGSTMNTSLNRLQVLCEKDYFAKEGEFCIACPSGAKCAGGFAYPVASPGFFNLNSSYSGADFCPASAVIKNSDGTMRDVCIVACLPSEACIGANQCSEAYRSTAPAYRCNACAVNYYKRASECIRCPDTPIVLVIGFIFLAIALAFIGYLLDRFKVNVVFVSIAIDYFQVISIFLNSKIQWPPVVKNLMYILSAFNLNLDLVAPECLVPNISYIQKFYFVEGLPLALIGSLFLFHILYTGYKRLILKRKTHLTRHLASLKASGILVMYFLYLYVTRTLFDVYNCAPTVPPSYDANGNSIKYLSVQFEECGKPGGIQQSLLPASILGILAYTIGFPALLAWLLYKWRETIMLDQLLRAGGKGVDRIENPTGYEIRKSYGRIYYQYKPDFFFWSLVILLRKFFIAITTVMFSTNPSFQMAACLLILFLSYSAQVQFNPFMSYSDYADVLKSHMEAAIWSPIHGRLKATLSAVQLQATRRYHRNILTVGGKLDKVALIQAMGSWLFNYNTVEATMLFCGVIITLMGIMYQSNLIVAGYDSSGRDALTGIIMAILIGSILYLTAVFGVEIYLAFAMRRKTLIRKKLQASAVEKSVRAFQIMESTDIAIPEINPIFLHKSLKSNLTITEFEDPPPKEIWTLFRELFTSQEKSVKEMQGQIAALKKQVATTEDGSIELVRVVRKKEISQAKAGPSTVDTKSTI